LIFGLEDRRLKFAKTEINRPFRPLNQATGKKADNHKNYLGIHLIVKV
jgi:hypothetical protein